MQLLNRVASELIGKPLLVTQDYAEMVLSAVADRIGITPIIADQSVLQAGYRPNRDIIFRNDKRIAVMPIVGGMSHRGGYYASSGNIGYTGIQNAITSLIEDGAKGIVLDMDTPGGSVAGIAATADFLKKVKSAGVPVYAIANTMAASAGYWLGCIPDRLYASEDAMVGSIGVLATHIDRSVQAEKEGVKVTFIHAGAHKVDGHPFAALPEDVRKSIQAGVDSVYSKFISHVAAMRGIDEQKVRDTEAAVFGPEEAKARGLIDGIASLDEVVDAMATRLRGPAVRGTSFPSPSHTGASAAMAENLIHSKADLDAAVASALAAERQAHATALQSAAADGATKAYSALTAALDTLFSGDARASAFLEAIADGMAPDKAAAFVAKHVAASAPAAAAANPTGRNADVARVFEAAAPSVPAGTADTSSAAPTSAPAANAAPDKAAFLAALGMKPGVKAANPMAAGYRS